MWLIIFACECYYIFLLTLAQGVPHVPPYGILPGLHANCVKTLVGGWCTVKINERLVVIL